MKRLNEGLKTLGVSLGVGLLLVMWFFGFEPQVSIRSGFDHMPDTTFSDYMAGSVAHYGDNLFVRTLTVVAYPGAKAGRLYHNWVCD